MDGGGDPEAIGTACSSCDAKLSAWIPNGTARSSKERLAKLAGGVGVIKVGAATEVEAKERKHRIEDAVSSTRAALEEGHRLRRWFRTGSRTQGAWTAWTWETTTQTWSVQIVRRALVQPLRWIAENAGEDGYVIVSRSPKLPGHGYNAKTGEYGDLIEGRRD